MDQIINRIPIMLRQYKYLFELLVVLCLNLSLISAQDNLNGVIYYDQVQEYKLEGAYNSPEWDSYIAQLPSKGNTQYKLSFIQERTLYEIDPESESQQNKKMKLALKKASYMKPPSPKSIKVFNDYGSGIQIQQVELLTKDFFVDTELKQLPWKITQTKKQVLDYVCLGAELNNGDGTITAYFSPQIPIPVGPGEYYGLPGAILSIEKNGDVLMEATSIVLSELGSTNALEILGEGQTISQEEFEKILDKKIQEFNINSTAKTKAKKKGKK
ncbi:MAG: GLPGLI family protein [Saprospiraceae bacterium]|nr:GLPGLI family protein [Saprospiraceae bacterium]